MKVGLKGGKGSTDPCEGVKGQSYKLTQTDTRKGTLVFSTCGEGSPVFWRVYKRRHKKGSRVLDMTITVTTIVETFGQL